MTRLRAPMPAEQKPIPPATGAPVVVDVPALTDFSQSGEQQMIHDWAQRHGPGRFLDVGATDGVTASNTRALALAGWGGVCVDPAPWATDALSALYADRPDIEVVQAALVAGVREALVKLHYSRHDLLSTTVDRYADTWSELVRFEPLWVATLTAQQLLTWFPGPYDLISVDVEGTTLELTGDLLATGALANGGLLCVECEHGGERWQAQQWCLNGFARVGVTPNNLLLERL